MTTMTNPSSDQRPSPDELMTQLVDSIASVIVVKVTEQMAATERSSRVRIAPEPRAGFLTVNEAAEFLRCKPQRIYNLLSERQLDRHRDGGRVLLRQADLEAWINGARQAAAGARRTRVGRPRSAS